MITAEKTCSCGCNLPEWVIEREKLISDMVMFIRTCADGLRNVTEDDARALLKRIDTK